MANIGDTITYTIVVGNNGPDVETNAIVVDTLPTCVDFVSADNGGVYDAAASTITWNFATVPVSASAYTLTIVTTASAANTNCLNSVSANGDLSASSVTTTDGDGNNNGGIGQMIDPNTTITPTSTTTPTVTSTLTPTITSSCIVGDSCDTNGDGTLNGTFNSSCDCTTEFEEEVLALCFAPSGTSVLKESDFDTYTTGLYTPVLEEWIIDSGASFNVKNTTDPNWASSVAALGGGYPLTGAQGSPVFSEIASSNAQPKLYFTIPDACTLQVDGSVWFANYGSMRDDYRPWTASINIYDIGGNPIQMGTPINFVGGNPSTPWVQGTVSSILGSGDYYLEIYVDDFGAFDNTLITITRP